MTDPPPRPTLAAVAAAAGVSRTTVSNAYNRPDQLSAAVRERVLAVAARLGYAGPNPLARSLRTSRAGVFGLLLSDRLANAFADPNAVEFLQGVGDACADTGRSLLLIAATADSSADTVARAAVDGFVVYSMPADDPNVAAVRQRPQPMVIVDGPRAVPRVDFVGITDRAGMAALTRHVVGLGHRRLAFVGAVRGGPAREGHTSLAALRSADRGALGERVAGLGAALSGTRAQVVGYGCAQSSVAAGLRAGRELLSARPVPTAILCFSDALALGVRAAADEAGVRVPDELTITGFDDIAGAAAAGLTTVRQPTREKGRQAIALLDAPRAGRRRVIELPTELVVRSSTGPVPR